jgi:hypothetical protein
VGLCRPGAPLRRSTAFALTAEGSVETESAHFLRSFVVFAGALNKRHGATAHSLAAIARNFLTRQLHSADRLSGKPVEAVLAAGANQR